MCEVRKSSSEAYMYSLLNASTFVLVSSGYHNKMSQTGQILKTEICFSQFWSLKVQDKGVSRFGFCGVFPLGLQMATYSLCLHTAFHLCLSIPGVSLPLLKSTLALSDQGLTIVTSFNLYYLLKGPNGKYSLIGVRASTQEFGRNSIHNNLPHGFVERMK